LAGASGGEGEGCSAGAFGGSGVVTTTITGSAVGFEWIGA
jgi:hypothetical protein